MAARAEWSAVAAEPATTRVYVTFLAGDHGERLKAVEQLAGSLRGVRSAYPLVVAVLPDVPEHHRQILVSQGCIVREIELVRQPSLDSMARYVNYSKLGIWEYERMVYLDPDTQVSQNIDELLELEKGHFYTVKDCFCDDKTWSHTPQYKIGYGHHQQQCPDKVAWLTAELGPPPAPYFNAGVFVHEPSKATAEALLDALRATQLTPFAEQDFLNMLFKDEYKPIPLEYNLVLDTPLSHPENEQIASKAKVVQMHNYATHPKKGEKLPPPFGSSWLATKATTMFAGKNLPAMATLAASSAALGVVTNAANPAICFAFYASFLAAIATVTLSLRSI